VNRILILRTGSTASQVLRVHGDYDRWFQDAMAAHPLSFEVHDVTREAVPAPDGFIGVIVTGSTSAAYRQEPWMAGLNDFLRGARTSGPPLLAVCLGAQILAQALGGRVILNPEGWEIGGIDVHKTSEASSDPLFANLPATFGALATHEDRIEELPPAAVLLASNANARAQAFRIGELIWGTQFHPEATSQILEKLILKRADQLARDAASHGREPDGHVGRLIETLRGPAIDQGRIVLDNFVRVCLRSAGKREEGPEPVSRGALGASPRR
jgi:GMP synthase (glutamine-hydrolysing)